MPEFRDIAEPQIPGGDPSAGSGSAEPPRRAWHALAAGEALEVLESSEEGLSDREAERRLARWGPNRLPEPPGASLWKIVVAQSKSLVMALLFVASFVALAMGDGLEAAAILAVLGINLALGVSTEWGARRAMESLRRLQTASARVIRDGVEQEIPAEDLVPGDVVVLDAGDAVPADARLLAATDLRTVEASLTGEPFPVTKDVAPVEEDALLAERTSMVYQGTVVSGGHALAVVTATARRTEVGEISSLLAQSREEWEETPLEERLDLLGRRLIFLTLVVAALVSVVGILRGGEVWLMVETGLALAIAAVPEGLPVVATITLAVGMHRMARRRALLRRLPAVETLGSATVVCTDKTGTLTAGEMTVTELELGGRPLEVTGHGYGAEGEILADGGQVTADDLPALRRALEVAVLANRARWSPEDPDPEGDPTEAALRVLGAKGGLRRDALLEEMPEVGEVPFSSEKMWMATFHRERGKAGSADAGVRICVKGAPGRVLDLCARCLGSAGEEIELDAAARESLLEANSQLASDGLRVLALADGRADAGTVAPTEDDVRDLVFLGLVGISDPPAEGVGETIASLRRAGIRTVMITGDQRATATAVAKELGLLEDRSIVLDGAEIGRLSADELAERLPEVGAFSRVSPKEKLLIVDAFRRRGEITAMLGDGVNDAPALQQADIGVAMGVRGTDIAKDAADLVLADDRFQTIAAAVEEGRVIFDNIRKFIFYLFSCNFSEVLVLLLASLVGLPLPLLPLQILWLNLVTDVFPALALGMEPGEPDVMERPPRDPDSAILSRDFLLQIGVYGLGLALATLGVFVWATRVADLGLERARTLTFMTLALTQLFHVFNARSPRAVVFGRRLLQNAWVWGAVFLTVGLQLLVVYLPALSRLFETVPLRAEDWTVVLAVSVLPLVVGQLVKALSDVAGVADDRRPAEG